MHKIVLNYSATCTCYLLHFLSQQRLNNFLLLLVTSLTNMDVAKIASFVNEILGRPVAIVISAPRLPIIVNCYGVRNILINKGLFDVFQLSFIAKFWACERQ